MLYAEQINYWKTSKTAPDTWMERAKKQITQPSLKGKVISEAYGSMDGKAAFILVFELEGSRFKIVWPVLKSRSRDERAEKVQAATMLYHDVKHRCVMALVLGARKAFFNYYMLDDGRSLEELADRELSNQVPQFLLAAGGSPVIEGEVM